MDYRVLGEFEVRHDGEPVDLGSPKARTVLAVLLAHRGQHVSTDRLIEDVWGEQAPRTAAHSIQTYVSGLRRVLGNGDNQITTGASGYRLDVEPSDIDACRFEEMAGRGASFLASGEATAAATELEAAVATWRGPPFGEFAYAEFAQPEIHRLEELHVSVVDDLAETYLRLGQPRRALPLARAAVTEKPLHERTRSILMQALAASGRQAEALQTYSSYRHLLAQELGIEPSAALANLEQRILVQDPATGPRVEPSGTDAPGSGRENPYRGLRPFTEADAGLFFGRTRLTAEMTAAVRDRPLVAVVGPSGSGKSSVVGAGLVPEVRRWKDWAVATMLPGRHPLLEAEAALARVSAAGDLLPVLESGPAGLLRAALRTVPADDTPLLLVVDQFEELFTLAAQDERERFLAALVAATQDPRGRLRVLLAVRADFYDQLLRAPGFGEVFAPGVINVLPLGAADLEKAAIAPAEAAGVGFEPELLAELVADTVGRPGALPLFQDVLTSLFEQRSGDTMTLADYERLGRLGGALKRRSEDVFAALGPEHDDVSRQIFLHLVVPQPEARASRRRAPLIELASIGNDPTGTMGAVDSYVQNRLLTLDRDSSTGEPTVEIAHESLLDAWDRLATWVDTAEEDLRNHDALLASARLWDDAGADPDYLWKGERLARYEAWLAETGFTIGPLEAAFLDAGITARGEEAAQSRARIAREERLATRARRRIWALAAAVVILAAVGTFAVLTYLALPRAPDVALVYEGEGDSGWNDMIVGGVERAADELNLDVGYYAAALFSIGRQLQEAADDGPGLVLVPSGLWEEPGVMAAAEHPETDYIILDVIPPDVFDAVFGFRREAPPNAVHGFFEQHHGSFLMGAAAAMKTQAGTVGFIGGVDSPFMWGFEYGFRAGVHAVDPNIEVLTTWLTQCWDGSGFLSPALAYDAATEMYDHGADVVFAAAGGGGLGVFDAADDVTETTGTHRWVIGVDTDQFHTSTALRPGGGGRWNPAAWGDHILTSMLKRMDLALRDTIHDWEADAFTPAYRSFGLVDRYIDYSQSGGYIVDIVPELERLRAQIISGAIDVPYFSEDRFARWPCLGDF